jgi:hypothetical protein
MALERFAANNEGGMVMEGEWHQKRRKDNKDAPNHYRDTQAPQEFSAMRRLRRP